ncbi:hypothetical protein GGF32_008509 [Allomyces javanicus]|nr:hypothetical protein GGF32_008509 [Allomyces javanicus]
MTFWASSATATVSSQGPTPTSWAKSSVDAASQASRAAVGVVGGLIITGAIFIGGVLIQKRWRQSRALMSDARKPAAPVAPPAAALAGSQAGSSATTMAPVDGISGDEPVYLPPAPVVEFDRDPLYLPTSQRRSLTPVIIEEPLYLPGNSPPSTTAANGRGAAPTQ